MHFQTSTDILAFIPFCAQKTADHIHFSVPRPFHLIYLERHSTVVSGEFSYYFQCVN